MSKKEEIKKELTKQVEGKFEITMYKLLIVFAVTMLLMLGIGMFSGNRMGFSRGVDAVEISAPDYCKINQRGEIITMNCGTTEIMSINDFCEESVWATKFSESLKEEIKVMIIFPEKV